MKSKRKFFYISLISLVCFIMTISIVRNNIHGKNMKMKATAPTYTSEKYENNLFETLKNDINNDINIKVEELKAIEASKIVYDGMTIEQLSEKLNHVLKNELSDKGMLFATHSLEIGVDPYVAVAIVLHETGCSYKCSSLALQCNNVGGMKTGLKCGNSAYGYFETLDSGIIAYIDNLYNNYYAVGLTTVEAINSKYASSSSWATKVNNYIAKIKAS